MSTCFKAVVWIAGYLIVGVIVAAISVALDKELRDDEDVAGVVLAWPVLVFLSLTYWVFTGLGKLAKLIARRR